MSKADAKDRLISAALGVAKAERGGLDQADQVAELEVANEIFDEAAATYYHTLREDTEGG